MKIPRTTSLVPAAPSEFSSSAFWEEFFQQRQRSFEWYGTYYDIQSVIHKYVKPTDRILVAGCGNSEMSEKMYDEGFKNITNVDNSQIVIDQMNTRKGLREMMHYYEMDLTNMEFYEDAFTVIIDKGTLDAVMSDKSPANRDTTDKLFSEYFRVLKNGGRYICITLGQDFILDKILEHFPSNGWLVRVHKVGVSSADGASGMPVFAFVMTKFKNLPQKILEICANDSFEATRVENESKIKDFVRSLQEYSLLLRPVRKKVNPDRAAPPIQMFSTSKGSSDHPRFVMQIVDRASFKKDQLFAVFVIPQGNETLRSFRTYEAKRKVAVHTAYQRLLFVTLHPEHKYGSQDELQAELNTVVMDFAPPGVKPTHQVPYLAISADKLERRVSKIEGRSSLSGRFVVEDFRCYMETDMWYRQLAFKSAESFILSEIRLRNDALNPKLEKGQKGMTVLMPDHTYLLPGYERSIVCGLFLRFEPEEKFRGLMLGVGGGAIPCFILHHFKNCQVTGVEIDPDIVEVAHTWFGLPRNKSQFQILTTDGIEYVMKLSERLNRIASFEMEKYDVIIVDLTRSTSKGVECPIVEAVELDYLEALYKILRKQGLLMINLSYHYDELMREKIMYNIRRVFKTVVRSRCRDFDNEILYCFADKPNFRAQPTKNSKKTNKKQRAKKNKKNSTNNENNISQNSGRSESLNTEVDEMSIHDGDKTSPMSPSSVNNSDITIDQSTELTQIETVEGAQKLNNGLQMIISGDAQNEKSHNTSETSSVLDEKFLPPKAKLPVRLDKYDSDWMMYWKERAASWNKVSDDVDFHELISNAMIEREVDYHNPPQIPKFCL